MDKLSDSQIKKLVKSPEIQKALRLHRENHVYKIRNDKDLWTALVLAEDPLPFEMKFKDRPSYVEFECQCGTDGPCAHFFALALALYSRESLYNASLRSLCAGALEQKDRNLAKTFEGELELFSGDFSSAASTPESADEPGRESPPSAEKARTVRYFVFRREGVHSPHLRLESEDADSRLDPHSGLHEDETEESSKFFKDLGELVASYDSDGLPFFKAFSLLKQSAVKLFQGDRYSRLCLGTTGRPLALSRIRTLSIDAVEGNSRAGQDRLFHLRFECGIDGPGKGKNDPDLVSNVDFGADSLTFQVFPAVFASEGRLSYCPSGDMIAFREEDAAFASLLTYFKRLPEKLAAWDLEGLRARIQESGLDWVRLRTRKIDGIEVRDVEPVPIVSLRALNGRTELFLSFSYASVEVALHDESETLSFAGSGGATVAVRRKPDAEAAFLNSLRSLIADSIQFERGLYAGLVGDRYVADLSIFGELGDFISAQGRTLMDAGFVLRMEGRNIRFGGSLGFRAESGLDWFGLRAIASGIDGRSEPSDPWDLNGSGTSVGTLGISPDSISEDGMVVAKDEDGKEFWVKLGARDIDRLTLLRRLGMDSEGFLRASGVNIALIESLYHEIENPDEEQVVRARAMAAELARVLQSDEGDDIRVEPPRSLSTRLRAYQQRGYEWLFFFYRNGLGACLADDMGLGKTIQTIALLLKLKEDGLLRPSLIVAPVVTLPNWEDEIARFAPSLRVLRHGGSKRPRSLEQLLGTGNAGTGDASPDLILVSYHTLRNDLDFFTGFEWDYIILDEAHVIKSASSQVFKAVRVLNGRHRLSLTGTPIENSTSELWTQFSFLNPGLLGTRAAFQRDVAGPIEREGDEEVLEVLRATISPFILRRRKQDVLKDLPPKDEILQWCEMSPSQSKLYEEHRSLYRDQIAGILKEQGVERSGMDVFRFLLRLRQLAIDPRLVDTEAPYANAHSAKLDSLMSLVEELCSRGHKVLIFSQFVSALSLIAMELEKRSLRYALLTGATKDRREEIRRFRDDEFLRVFLLSLKAGGVGINLTEADYVVIYDPWWNPAAERQAVDRAHRIGQKRPVTVYKFITRGTIEEKILALQHRKHRLAGTLISGEDTMLHGLSESDVLDLFA